MESEPGKLKGKLLQNLEDKSSMIEFSEEWLKQQTVIQRDGEEEYVVNFIKKSTLGSTPKIIVQLKSLKDSHTINKEFTELIDKLKTPGSPWRIKK